jgi:D-glycero-D-manno-heptose 1,7-bisphosphate phosphatase
MGRRELPPKPSAVFLDRDGTIMRDTAYPRDPSAVELLPGAAEAIARLNRAGIPVVVVTNQSGIARGFLTEDDYRRVRERLDQLLAAHDARLDAVYHCPHHPDVNGDCGCRKPATLLFERAAADLAVDPRTAAFVGDRWRDVSAAVGYGAAAFLVDPSPEELAAAAGRAETVPSLSTAVDLLLGATREAPAHHHGVEP